MEHICEELKVVGKDLVGKVKSLIHEGNVRRVIVKDDKGNTFIEIPIAVAAIGAIAAPVLAALGALAGMIAHFTVVVERAAEPSKDEPASPSVPS
jgi:hypothetical protein